MKYQLETYLKSMFSAFSFYSSPGAVKQRSSEVGSSEVMFGQVGSNEVKFDDMGNKLDEIVLRV